MEPALIPKRIRLDLDKSNIKTCKHYVKRKKRFCKMVVGNGKDFCGEHEPPSDDQNNVSDNSRIVCPLDNKHTVYKINLRKHLKICNARQKQNLPDFIEAGVNDGSSDSEDESTTQIDSIDFAKLSNIPREKLLRLIAKIENIYKEYVENKIVEEFLQHDILRDELDQLHYGKDKIKHLTQTSSILGYIDSNGLLRNETSFIEFGAGKGQVSYWLAKLIATKSDLTNTNVTLIDRASLRHKKDNKLDDRSTVHRIRADIADCVLEKLENLKCAKNIVAIGKHLCGGATDLMLRSLLRCGTDIKNIDFIVSLCCHHRCSWKSFVGKDFLKSCSISHGEFDLIIKMVSWAVCGAGMSREKRREMELHRVDMENTIVAKDNHLQLPNERREEIGLMCKRILDYARLKHMSSKGFDVHLKFYTNKEITLENVCLVGKKSASNKE